VFEGTLIGKRGAPQATGGTLQLTADYSPLLDGDANLELMEDTAAALTAVGSTFNLATYVPTASSTILTIANLPGTTLAFGADSLTNSGFSSLILNSQGLLGFAGQVSLKLNNSFIASFNSLVAGNAGVSGFGLAAGASPTNGASLTVAAPYIEMSGGLLGNNGPNAPGTPAPPTGDATLTLSANEMDIAGGWSLINIGQATFISTRDIRLLPFPYAPPMGGTALVGWLLTTGNLTFEAADVYPATDTAFIIEATQQSASSPTTTVTFAYPAGGGPSTTTPLSANGALLVDANFIVQNGEIQAPFGSIILGITGGTSSTLVNAIGTALNGANPYLSGGFAAVNTQSVTLGSGSITSVSANGATIPYGSTVDQTTCLQSAAQQPDLERRYPGNRIHLCADDGAAGRGHARRQCHHRQYRRGDQSRRRR
jgi:hypothetical protein